MSQRDDMLEVLRAARELLARPGNRFAGSSWDNADEALVELDGYVTTLAAGWLPPRLDLGVLFAPTGPIQEVGRASGWSDEFVALAARFDAAETELYG